jgi:hypothetical protein
MEGYAGGIRKEKVVLFQVKHANLFTANRIQSFPRRIPVVDMIGELRFEAGQEFLATGLIEVRFVA